jgi:hypothetical protein
MIQIPAKKPGNPVTIFRKIASKIWIRPWNKGTEKRVGNVKKHKAEETEYLLNIFHVGRGVFYQVIINNSVFFLGWTVILWVKKLVRRVAKLVQVAHLLATGSN